MHSEPCGHPLKDVPGIATDGDGVSYLLFECLLCGSKIGVRLSAEGEVAEEFILSAQRRSD